MMEKPPSLPEQIPPDATEPHAAAVESESETKGDTQPRKPGIIPPPPKGALPPPVMRRRRKARNKQRGWLSALAIAALLSLIIILVGFIVMLIYLPEYVDPFIPGRLATRTAEAEIALATEAAVATRESNLMTAQAQAAANAAATGTAVILESQLRATQNALNAEGTANALVQTATGAAVSFDATRTSVALQSQSTAAVNTLEAVRFTFTQTAVAQQAQGTAAAATVEALRQRFGAAQQSTPTGPAIADVQAPQQQPNLPNAGSEPPESALPTVPISRFNIYFEDTFDQGLDAAWTMAGNWRSVNGMAVSEICGTSITVGSTDWTNFAIQVDVNNPGAVFAVQTGYGDAGRLYINFGLGGSVWWLVDGANAISDDTRNGVYDPTRPNRIRVIVEGQAVSVYVDGILISERVLPESPHGAVGLYTCPTRTSVPLFDNFRVIRLPG